MTDRAGVGEPPGLWLRRQREAARLTQEELAERSGLSTRAIRDLECDRTRRPYPRSVRLVAGALGLTEAAAGELIARYRVREGGSRLSSHLDERGSRDGRLEPLAMPRQLPAGARHFVGRAEELERLTGFLDQARADAAVMISAICGTAGVGKTALAVHWAHQVAGRFPDGQLHVNLRGYGPPGEPVAPGEAVRGFLDALGIPADRIPVNLDAQAGLYRSLLAGKKMLVLLDNARDAGQVRPLLPGSPGCLVLVTSRNQLTSLLATEDASLACLGVLSEAEACELLATRMGAARAAAEPAAIRELAVLCAGLPLALSIVAARAIARPGWPLKALAAELTDGTGQLDMLDAGDAATNVRAVFSWSYRQLGESAARMFRLLGIHPGPDLSLRAAASMAGLPVTQAQIALGELSGAHLVWEHSPGRFTFHDLLRAYAAEQCQACDPPDERRAAAQRVLDHYLHTGYAAAAHYPISVGLALPALPQSQPGVVPEELDDRGQALAWFRAEHKVLIGATAWAADRSDGHAMRIPLALRPFLQRGGHWQESVTTGATALAAACRLGDAAGQAYAHLHLGCTYIDLGACPEGDAHLREALAMYQKIGDPRGQGATHAGLQRMFELLQRPADALRHAERSLEQFRAADDHRGEATALNNLGWCHLHLGNARQALPLLRHAADLQHAMGYSIGLAATLDSLGYAHHLLGRHRQAITSYRRAHELARQSADRPLQALILDHLGDTRQAAGEPRAARQAWEQARDILTDMNPRDAHKVGAKLASLRT